MFFYLHKPNQTPHPPLKKRKKGCNSQQNQTPQPYTSYTNTAAAAAAAAAPPLRRVRILSPPFSHERRVAELAVQRAAMAPEYVRKQHIANAVSWKADHSPVSVADYASQSLLMAAIRGAFPDARIVAEETSEELRANKSLLHDVWDLVSLIAGERGVQNEGNNDDDNDGGRSSMLACPWSPDELLGLFDVNTQQQQEQQGDTIGRGTVWTMGPIDGTMTYLEGTHHVIVIGLYPLLRSVFTRLT